METAVAPAPFGASLFRHLGRLVSDPSVLPAFRQWFSSALWEAETGDDDVSDDILDLAHRVENLLAILDSGTWTVDQLVSTLRIELEARRPRSAVRTLAKRTASPARAR